MTLLQLVTFVIDPDLLGVRFVEKISFIDQTE